MGLAIVTIHSSQFPDNVRRDLLHSLHTRQINPKFHYDSYKQSQKWLALHEAYSPARTDLDCLAMYDRAFAAAAERMVAAEVEVVGLGSGGAQKETRLLGLLAAQRREVSFRPCDVSLPLVLTAQQTACAAVVGLPCRPLVCDLALADDLHEFFGLPGAVRPPRLFTFFGMIPNFEPDLILPHVAELLHRDDWLLFSANLAPGPDYAAGVERIRPGYDNALTRDWLTTFLFDLGFKEGDGAARFTIEESKAGYKKVAAYFDLTETRGLTVHGERMEFRAGESIRLFFSYRYTPEMIRALLKRYQLHACEQWVTASGEEGVFLCQKE